MAKNRIVYFLSLICCLVFFWSYRLWFSWFALMAVLCLPLFSLLMSLLTMPSARLKLCLPHSIPLGTPQPLALHHGSILCPPWRCKLVVHRPMTNQVWEMKADELLPTDHCGALICTIQNPRVYDYLGLFSMKMKHDPKKTVLVMPEPIPMRLPALDANTVHIWKPKWGGGFAENHELRQYVPGDSIRQIHWKLSAKTGALILRQPMEPVRQQIAVTMELCGTRAELDRKLGRLLWVSQTLLDRDLPFLLQTVTGQGLRTYRVSSEQDHKRMMEELLCAAPAVPNTSSPAAPAADLLIYIGGGADET